MSRELIFVSTDLKLKPKDLKNYEGDIWIRAKRCNLDEFFTEYSFNHFLNEDVSVAKTEVIYDVLEPLFAHVNDVDIHKESSKFCNLFYKLVCEQNDWEENYVFARDFVCYIKEKAKGKYIYLEGN